MQHSTLLDEDFPSRVEALFPDADSARAAAMVLCQRYQLDASQIRYVTVQPGASGGHRSAGHRNRFAHRASGRTLQTRQVKRTLGAFAVLLCGLPVLHVLHHYVGAPGWFTGVLLGLMIVVALGLTVSGMLSWRPARERARTQPRDSKEVVLVFEIHDVREQVELRTALKELGADTEPGNIADIA